MCARAINIGDSPPPSALRVSRTYGLIGDRSIARATADTLRFAEQSAIDDTSSRESSRCATVVPRVLVEFSGCHFSLHESSLVVEESCEFGVTHTAGVVRSYDAKDVRIIVWSCRVIKHIV